MLIEVLLSAPSSKWKADRHSVEAVCCYDNGGLLLTAGRTIKLWNLEDYTMIKVGVASYHRDASP